MADFFTLSGSYEVRPATGSPSLDPSIVTTVLETTTLKQKHLDSIDLTVDTPVSVAFGGVVNAHVVIVKAVGGKIRVRLSSADGALQSVPVDDFLILESLTVPITAMDLTRTPATATTVKVFLGEKP